MASLLQTGDIVVPVLLCVLLGFGLGRMQAPFDTKMVTSLVALIGYPTLVLSHLEDQHVVLSEFLQMLLAGTCAVLTFGLVGFTFLRSVGLPTRAYLAPMMLNNTGNIGLSVALLAFGNQGLSYAIAFVVVILTGIFTIGIWLPMGRVSLKELFKQPVIYTVVLAVILMATDTRLPRMLDNAFSILGGLTIPLLLLTLGHTLARIKIGNLWHGCYLSLFHLAMGASVAYFWLHLFGFEGPARGVFILQCVMPISLATYLWVEKYVPEHAEDVAGFAVISTCLSIVVLPVVLAFWVH